MARHSTVLFAIVILSAGLITGQTTSESQKPGREKLNYFAGTWTVEVHMAAGAFGSRSFFGRENNEWISNGSLLVSRQEGDVGLNGGGLGVLGYNAQNKAYTYHVVKNTGETEDLKGTFEGRTWTWTSVETGSSSGRAKTRVTMQELSSTSYLLRVETSLEGREWSTVMEGKASKVVPRARQDVAFLR
jgi:hypothetical protein